MMSVIVILEVANLFFAGLLSGAEYVVRYGVRVPLNVLDVQPQLQFRQALIRTLRLAVPAVYVPTILSALAVTIMNGTSTGLVFRCVGLLAMLIWSITTFLGTVPLNQDLLTWLPEAPPENWRAVIAKWERLDMVRFWAALIAFASFITAVAVRLITIPNHS